MPDSGATARPMNQGACGPQNASRFLYEGLPAFGGTDNLNQQHRIERIIAKRQTLPVGLQKRRTKARLIAPTRKLAQHAEREIDGNVVIVGRHERAPNSSGPAPDVEQARPRCCIDRVEDRRADRRRHVLGQRPMQIEAVRYRQEIANTSTKYAMRDLWPPAELRAQSSPSVLKVELFQSRDASSIQMAKRSPVVEPCGRRLVMTKGRTAIPAAG